MLSTGLRFVILVVVRGFITKVMQKSQDYNSLVNIMIIRININNQESFSFLQSRSVIGRSLICDNGQNFFFTD